MTDNTTPRLHPSWLTHAMENNHHAHVVVTNHHELALASDLRMWLETEPEVGSLISYLEPALGVITLEVDDIREFAGESAGFAETPNSTVYAHIVR